MAKEFNLIENQMNNINLCQSSTVSFNINTTDINSV